MCRRSHDTNLNLYSVKFVCWWIKASVSFLLSFTNKCCPTSFFNIKFAFCSCHKSHIVFFDCLSYNVCIACKAKFFEQFAKLVYSTCILSPFNISFPCFWSFWSSIRIWTWDELLWVSKFNEYTLWTVFINTVSKFCKRQNVAFWCFVYKAFSCCWIDVDGIVTATKSKLTVVNPRNWHQLSKVHTCCSSVCTFTHSNTVTNLWRAVCCLCLFCDFACKPVVVCL